MAQARVRICDMLATQRMSPIPRLSEVLPNGNSFSPDTPAIVDEGARIQATSGPETLSVKLCCPRSHRYEEARCAVMLLREYCPRTPEPTNKLSISVRASYIPVTQMSQMTSTHLCLRPLLSTTLDSSGFPRL